jgi:hypothetical protein
MLMQIGEGGYFKTDNGMRVYIRTVMVMELD